MARTFLAALVAGAALALAGPAAAPAQALRLQTLVIDRAGVRVDGEPVRDVQAPGALALDRLEGTYRFEGPVGSTVEVNGVRYRLEGGRLTLDHALDAAPAAVFTLGRTPTRIRFGTRSLVAPDEVAPYATEQEWALEATAFDLALRVRATPFGATRTALVADLRKHLTETFALKQSLRFRELEALEADVRALRTQLEAREAQRARLVEQRLQALVGRQP